MRRVIAGLVTVQVAVLAAAAAVSTQSPPRIQVVAHSVAPRVDITIDGKPFTSYIFERAQKKPFLYPLRTAAGTVVSRGYPIEPRPFERTDHPHHIGLWFNYGDVNGLDFWNNSDAVPADRAAKMGTVVHKRVIEATSGKDKGELNVEMDWVDSNGTILLKENTHYVFSGDDKSRTIDRITRLTALKDTVVLGDNKEGLLGIRVTRELEAPSQKPEVYTDAAGKENRTRVVQNEGVVGNYVGSDGKTGDAVWGTRGPWMMLGGKVGPEQVTLAVLDHPSNTNFPTVWHARGYGLFAANNLGRKSFDPQLPESKITLQPSQSVTFRHRVLILSGTPDPAKMAAEHKTFAAAK
jgi:Methane oxygenase PmoA